MESFADYLQVSGSELRKNIEGCKVISRARHRCWPARFLLSPLQALLLVLGLVRLICDERSKHSREKGE